MQFFLRCSSALLVLSASFVRAEDITVSPLTDEQRLAMATIEEKSVRSTISFLASDEMAGRDTPSKELDIASAYVASRFDGAGLKAIGDDGTYFQNHQLTVSRPPADGIQLLDSAGRSVAVRGVLATGPEKTQLTGTVIDAATAGKASRIEGPVLVPDIPLPPQALGRPEMALAVWWRRIREFRTKNAPAILVVPASESILRELLPLLLQKAHLETGVTSFECPVVILSESAPDLLGQSVTLTVPAQHTESAGVRNVIGVIRGSDPVLANDAILITAHLDHIGVVDHGMDRINNGADDNATGVTGVLTLADAFAKLDPAPKRSVIFMTFWGEEKGLLGSKYFAENPLWPLDRIVANVNLEMIGRPESDAREKAWMTGWRHSNLGNLLNAGSIRVGVEIFDRSDIGEMLYTRSDNASFVQRGVIAHSVSAGSLHADYHQPGDEWTKLDLPHMTRVIQGLFAAVLPLADGEVTPEKR
ncbi:MAG: M28 family peptidase [Planctomycetaceae bacterium]